MATAPGTARAGFLRVNGILVLVLLVATGFGVGALYYSYKEPRVRAELRRELDKAPTTAEGRVQRWMEYCAPQAHHRLAVFARVSADLPWIVTHVVDDDSGGPPMAYGIDVSDLPHDLLRREGLTIVLELERPRALRRVHLGGDSALHIPHLTHELGQDEADARLAQVVRFLLADLVSALPRDIEGAELEIRVGGAT